MNAQEFAQQPHVIAYLNELAAQIAVDGGLEGKELLSAVSAAHKARTNFLVEMINQKTPRAVMARMALATSVRVAAFQKKAAEEFSQRVNEFVIANELNEARELVLSI